MVVWLPYCWFDVCAVISESRLSHWFQWFQEPHQVNLNGLPWDITQQALFKYIVTYQ